MIITDDTPIMDLTVGQLRSVLFNGNSAPKISPPRRKVKQRIKVGQIWTPREARGRAGRRDVKVLSVTAFGAFIEYVGEMRSGPCRRMVQEDSLRSGYTLRTDL